MKYFEIEIVEGEKKGIVYGPSSLERPKSNSVMFITSAYMDKWEKLLLVDDCLVFWPEAFGVPEEVLKKHFVKMCERPRLEYAKFFKDNNLFYMTLESVEELNYDRFQGRNITIMPNVYIGKDVIMGENVYIGSGVRLTGRISIGNNVVIRENTVIGADGLSMEKDEEGSIIPIPHYGGVKIEDNVIIGANVVIARGVMDDTIISRGCMIDNCCFISHNVILEENVAMVGESIVFGSGYIEKNSFISGNATIRDKVRIGKNAFVGMGSTVLKDVEEGSVVCGTPAKKLSSE